MARLLWFFGGLFVAVSGFAMVITAGQGAGPWDIFHIGVQKSVNSYLASAQLEWEITLGLVVQVTGAVIILLNLLVGIRPTVGMVMNMLAVGPILDFVLGLLERPEALLARWSMLLVGILLAGLGTALYTSADLGAGPRDGLMIGLTRRLNVPVAIVRNGIELMAALLGWRLGGPLGLGTIVVALGLGPSVQFGMAVVARMASYSPFSAFVRPVQLRRTG